jgi:hypothetical protein
MGFDTAFILNIVSELAYLLIVFGLFLGYALLRGRQATINIIVGLYFALLISLEFPYYDLFIRGVESASMIAIIKLVIFGLFVLLSTILFTRIMPDEFREKKWESFGKKLLLAGAATILVMTFSFHVLPVTDLMMPGTPIQALFSSVNLFFWWLITPLVILYLV